MFVKMSGYFWPRLCIKFAKDVLFRYFDTELNSCNVLFQYFDTQLNSLMLFTCLFQVQFYAGLFWEQTFEMLQLHLPALHCKTAIQRL